jgi:acyl-CoA thioester hydrolase
VRREWIDHNGHMNMGYYLVVFDFATDAWFRYLGLGEPHRAAQAVTTFCLQAHVTYHREVRAGDPLRFTTQLLAWDAKRSTISTRCTTPLTASSPRRTSWVSLHERGNPPGRADGARDPRAARAHPGHPRCAAAAG